MDKDRKTVIADAAIDLLASAGSKGLTHRAVDAHAGLPTGSTSFYCRTRQELLTLALRRHAALDLQDLADDASQWTQGAATPERFVESLALRVVDWLSPAKHARLVARFELFLIASREPDLAAIVQELRASFLMATVEGLRRVGVAHPEAVAPGLIMTVDGVLMSQISETSPTLTHEQCKALLNRVIQATAS
jgi:DNA-binding transcriptional regulator YbjK